MTHFRYPLILLWVLVAMTLACRGDRSNQAAVPTVRPTRQPTYTFTPTSTPTTVSPTDTPIPRYRHVAYPASSSHQR